jgi:hypothetical protein
MLEVDTKAIRHIHHTYLFTRTWAKNGKALLHGALFFC